VLLPTWLICLLQEENSIPLLAIADYYFIPMLKKLVSDFLATNIKRENAIDMLKRALKFHAKVVLTLLASWKPLLTMSGVGNG
jgi:hypothetical protein